MWIYRTLIKRGLGFRVQKNRRFFIFTRRRKRLGVRSNTRARARGVIKVSFFNALAVSFIRFFATRIRAFCSRKYGTRHLDSSVFYNVIRQKENGPYVIDFITSRFRPFYCFTAPCRAQAQDAAWQAERGGGGLKTSLCTSARTRFDRIISVAGPRFVFRTITFLKLNTFQRA